MSYSYLLELMLPAVVFAGRAIREIPAKHCNPREKQDRTPVTEADMASNIAMKDWLEFRDPESLYLSEEIEQIENFHVDAGSEFWLADPLDGTSEFMAGNEEYGVCLAKISHGNPVAGAILLPAAREVFWGIPGIGAYRACVSEEVFLAKTGNEIVHALVKVATPLQCRGLDSSILKGHIRVLCSRRHGDKNTEQHVRDLPSYSPQVVGACLKFLALAKGEADYYPRLAQLHEWDIAAGHAILLAAGGSVKQYGTEIEVRYGNPSFLAPWFQAFG